MTCLQRKIGIESQIPVFKLQTVTDNIKYAVADESVDLPTRKLKAVMADGDAMRCHIM